MICGSLCWKSFNESWNMEGRLILWETLSVRLLPKSIVSNPRAHLKLIILCSNMYNDYRNLKFNHIAFMDIVHVQIGNYFLAFMYVKRIMIELPLYLGHLLRPHD